MSSSRAITGDRRGLRRTLVIGQVALALVLVTATLLTVRSLERLLRVSPGFQTAQRLSLRIELPARYDTPDSRAQFYDRAIAALARLPGSRTAGATSHLPLSGSYLGSTFAIASDSAGEPFGADHRSVSPSYFETMRIPLLQGRGFDAVDRRDGRQVAIIDETLARRLWPRGDALGKRLIWQRGNVALDIVGIAGAVRHAGLDRAPRETVYRPMTQFTWPSMVLLVQGRDDADVARLAAPARAAIRALDAGVAVADVKTLDDVAEETVGRPALQARVLTGFGTLALLLALTGLYALLSVIVLQRTPEIGLRVALGATPGDVLRLLLRDGLTMAAAGVGVGLLLAAGLVPLLLSRLGGLLYGVSATDPAAYLLAPALLLVTALAASAVPAWRAARIDPIRALRQD